MINQEEAFWAGIAIATMMLGGGFSMLFLRAYTGYGAVVLSLGLMTMALTLQARAKTKEQYIEPTTPIESYISAPTKPVDIPTHAESNVPVPTPPVEYPTPMSEPEPVPEPVEAEDEPQQQSIESSEKTFEPNADEPSIEPAGEPTQASKLVEPSASTTTPAEIRPAQTDQQDELQPAPEPVLETVEVEAEPQQQPVEPSEKTFEPNVEPSTQRTVEPSAPTTILAEIKPVQTNQQDQPQPAPEPTLTSRPQTAIDKKPETRKSEEKPKEEAQVEAAAS